MTAAPIFGYKTSTVAGTSTSTPVTGGKADSTNGTDSTSSTSSYVDQLAALGGEKQAPATNSSGDPVTDLLNTLNQINQQGVPSGLDPQYTKISAEDALSKFPDSPDDVLTKYNSVIATLQKKMTNIDTGLSNGGGTSQQVQAAQQLKSQLQDLLNFYTVQRDKVAAYIPQKEASWTQELQDFMSTGIGKPPNPDWAKMADKDGDGWIGKPDAPGSYHIGVRTFTKSYEDPVAKKLGLPYKFKAGDTQTWAVNPTTSKRVEFSTINGKVVNENAGSPGYVADLGVGFSDGPNDNVGPDSHAEITLHTDVVPTNPDNYMESGLVLHPPEYVWAEVDANGDLVTDDTTGSPKIAPFQLDKEGHLTQSTPDPKGSTHYKQVYVKEMDVSSDSDGNIKVVYQGINPSDGTPQDLMTMNIQGKDKDHKATNTALAITSGDGDSHRETPAIIDASSYESTCRQGLKSTVSFDPMHKFKYSNGKAIGPNAAQINDTLTKFMAKDDTGEIDSVRDRGISFKGMGILKGPDGANNYYEIEQPPDYLTNKDAAYTTVVEGGSDGNNALFADGKGSLFANGMTLVSKDSGDAEDDVMIGVNAYAPVKDPTTGDISNNQGTGSNKLYIDVNDTNGTIAFQSVADGVDADGTKASPSNPFPGWKPGDDYYNLTAKTVGITSIDEGTAKGTFDPDLTDKANGQKAIHGDKQAISSGDFASTGSSAFATKKTELDKAIGTKATDSADYNWNDDNSTQAWMNAQYYQEAQTQLDSFFGAFNASKGSTMDPMFQETAGEQQAATTGTGGTA